MNKETVRNPLVFSQHSTTICNTVMFVYAILYCLCCGSRNRACCATKVTVQWTDVACRSWRRNTHEDGGSNLDKAVEFSPYFLRSVNSGDVLYPWLFVSVACISLLGETCLLVNDSWSCATVL